MKTEARPTRGRAYCSEGDGFGVVGLGRLAGGRVALGLRLRGLGLGLRGLGLGAALHEHAEAGALRHVELRALPDDGHGTALVDGDGGHQQVLVGDPRLTLGLTLGLGTGLLVDEDGAGRHVGAGGHVALTLLDPGVLKGGLDAELVQRLVDGDQRDPPPPDGGGCGLATGVGLLPEPEHEGLAIRAGADGRLQPELAGELLGLAEELALGDLVAVAGDEEEILVDDFELHFSSFRGRGDGCRLRDLPGAR